VAKKFQSSHHRGMSRDSPAYPAGCAAMDQCFNPLIIEACRETFPPSPRRRPPFNRFNPLIIEACRETLTTKCNYVGCYEVSILSSSRHVERRAGLARWVCTDGCFNPLIIEACRET